VEIVGYEMKDKINKLPRKYLNINLNIIKSIRITSSLGLGYVFNILYFLTEIIIIKLYNNCLVIIFLT